MFTLSAFCHLFLCGVADVLNDKRCFVSHVRLLIFKQTTVRTEFLTTNELRIDRSLLTCFVSLYQRLRTVLSASTVKSAQYLALLLYEESYFVTRYSYSLYGDHNTFPEFTKWPCRLCETLRTNQNFPFLATFLRAFRHFLDCC